LYNTPPEIRKILETHEMTPAYKASVMLVLLKQFDYEYSNFHQGYSLNRGMFQEESPFFAAYIRIVGEHTEEYMTARVVYDWVNEHPDFLGWEEIAEVRKNIDATECKILEMIK
jgi:hypothetical protein